MGSNWESLFREHGFVHVANLFDSKESTALLNVARADQRLAAEAYAKVDAQGGESRLSVRNDLDDSPYAAVVRSQRVAGTMAKLLNDEVYHYHHKMMLKEPKVGGAWEWHQDYGYWYQNGCLFPDMASCLIALDPANRENGCLQVIRGSHLMGRVDHFKQGDQWGADQQRVDQALNRMELVYCEMNPGDAIFFHGNLLHKSDANTGNQPRWSLICCFNTRHNDPFVQNGRHPNYSPLEIWPDDEVRQKLLAVPT